MARHLFGGTLADWTFARVDGVDGVDDLAQLVGGVTVTFWNLETGGSQYTDLLDEAGNPVTHVVSSDGTDGREIGTIPPLQGPDGITSMWAQGDDGPRLLIASWDTGSVAQDALDTAAGAVEALEEHISQRNPHQTATVDLTDVAATAPQDNQVPTWNAASGQYEPRSAPGTGTVTSVNEQAPDSSGNVSLAPGQLVPSAATAADMTVVRTQMHVLLMHTSGGYPAKPAGFSLAIHVGPTEPVTNVVDGDIWLQPEQT